MLQGRREKTYKINIFASAVTFGMVLHDRESNCAKFAYKVSCFVLLLCCFPAYLRVLKYDFCMFLLSLETGNLVLGVCGKFDVVFRWSLAYKLAFGQKFLLTFMAVRYGYSISFAKLSFHCKKITLVCAGVFLTRYRRVLKLLSRCL